MSSSRPPPSPAAEGHPIRRGTHARRRILAGALEVLAQHGLSGLTMEAIARQAGAGKATVYRHWPSPAAVLVDAMDHAFQPLPRPTTGDLTADLTDLLAGQRAMLAPSAPFPRLMAAFIDAAERDPALSGLHAQLTARRRAPLLEILARAQERGEIIPGADLELVADLLVGPMFYNRFIAHRPIRADWPATIVEYVLAGIRATASTHDS